MMMDGRGRCRRRRGTGCPAGTSGPGRGGRRPADAAPPHYIGDPGEEVTKEEELRMLQEEEMMLDQELEDLSKAIEDLRTKEKKEVNK